MDIDAGCLPALSSAGSQAWEQTPRCLYLRTTEPTPAVLPPQQSHPKVTRSLVSDCWGALSLLAPWHTQSPPKSCKFSCVLGSPQLRGRLSPQWCAEEALSHFPVARSSAGSLSQPLDLPPLYASDPKAGNSVRVLREMTSWSLGS